MGDLQQNSIDMGMGKQTNIMNIYEPYFRGRTIHSPTILVGFCYWILLPAEATLLVGQPKQEVEGDLRAMMGMLE